MALNSLIHPTAAAQTFIVGICFIVLCDLNSLFLRFVYINLPLTHTHASLLKKRIRKVNRNVLEKFPNVQITFQLREIRDSLDVRRARARKRFHLHNFNDAKRQKIKTPISQSPD